MELNDALIIACYKTIRRKQDEKETKKCCVVVSIQGYKALLIKIELCLQTGYHMNDM